MAVAVSCGIGMLVFGCCLGIFGACATVGGARSAGRFGMWWGAVRSLGAAMQRTGAVPSRMVEWAMTELGAVLLPGGRVLPALDPSMALGLVLVLSVACGMVFAVVAASVWGFAVGIAVPAVMLAARGVARERALRRRIEAAMPEAFGALAISLGSGLSLAQAMRYVGSHAEDPIKTEFTRVACSIECGVAAGDALAEMIERLRAPGLELVALALRVSQRTGAPLNDLLTEATRVVGDRIELQRQLDVKTAQARMSAQIVACMPVGMVAILAVMSSDFQAGIATVPGAVSVALALVLNGAAWMIIRRVMKVRL